MKDTMGIILTVILTVKHNQTVLSLIDMCLILERLLQINIDQGNLVSGIAHCLPLLFTVTIFSQNLRNIRIF